MIDMYKYYEYRKKFRDLYSNNPYSNNDLGSRVFEIRDRYKYLISIKFDINSYYIEAELEEGSPFDKVMKVRNNILDCIRQFLLTNINSIPVRDSIDRKDLEYLLTKSELFCDCVVIGNMVKINL